MTVRKHFSLFKTIKTTKIQNVYGMVWYGMVWYVTPVWYGTVCNGMIWYDSKGFIT